MFSATPAESISVPDLKAEMPKFNTIRLLFGLWRFFTQAEMPKFNTKIVNMMKSEGLFEWQEEPVILSEIENEFGPLEWDQGEPAKACASWATNMAVALNTGYS